MSFADFLIHAKDKAQCPTCKKPFDLLEQVQDPETGDVIVKIECHGETHHEVVPKAELEELEIRRRKALDDINKAAEVLKESKIEEVCDLQLVKSLRPRRRIVTIDDATRHFAKFKRLK